MKQWWSSLSSRDRLVLMIGGAVTAVLLFYSLVLDPLDSGVQELQKKIRAQGQDLAWMQQAATQVAALRGSDTAKPKREESLLSAIDISAREANLGDAVRRIQPEGEDKARIWFENVAFDELVRWMNSVQREYGVLIENATIDSQPVPGRVNMRLVLKEGGA